MQSFVLAILLITFSIPNNINLCSGANVPDNGYINPPPPPVDGYDPPVDGYDAPDPCFSYDTDSPFNDIQPAPYAKDGAFGTKSVQECQQLCQCVGDCKFFVYDTRLFSKKCWLKTGKSFILPPVAGTILGPKYCDGYRSPGPSPISDNYNSPDPNYNEPKDTSHLCDGYNAPGNNYEEPDPFYQEPNSFIQVPSSSYEEVKSDYREPDPAYKEPIAINPRGNSKESDRLRFPSPGA